MGPFLAIAISNFGLIILIYRKKAAMGNKATSKEQKSRHDRMNLTVLLMTFLFILMTTPIAMASFFFDELTTTDYGQFIIVLVDFISFCYHGLNIFIMAITNRIFYNECLQVVGLLGERVYSTTRSVSRVA